MTDAPVPAVDAPAAEAPATPEEAATPPCDGTEAAVPGAAPDPAAVPSSPEHGASGPATDRSGAPGGPPPRIRRVALPDRERPVGPCTGCRGENYDRAGHCAGCGMPHQRQDRFEADLGTVCVVTDRGLVHEHNEDSVAVAVLDGPAPGQPGATVIVVCDGVSTSEDPQAASGAAARAGVAASLAAFGAGAVLEEVALAGLSAAAKAVRAVGTPEGRAPSCTYVSAVLVPTADGTHITVANVGDSRAYWLAAPAPSAPGTAPGRAAPGAPAPSGATGTTTGASVSTGPGASAAPGAVVGGTAAGAPATPGSPQATDTAAGTGASAGPGASAAPGAAAGSTTPGGSAPSDVSDATSTTAGTSAWTGSGASSESGASAGSGAMGAAVESTAPGGSAASGVSGVTDTTGAGTSAIAGSGVAAGAGAPGHLGVVTGSRRLTDDDSLAQDFIKISGVDERTAMSMRGAHTLTRWLGADIGTTPWAEDSVRSMHATGPGALLLCSDGLWNYLPEAEALGDYTFGPAGATGPVGLPEARALVDFAIRQGGSDNITVALAPVPGAAQPPR
ncbi:hypothetical protein [Nocardia otitidiscaviarum]|nr:hypothetical protein [Nocardia otitidiscaviarum]